MLIRFCRNPYSSKVKCWIRQTEKPIDGVGYKPIAVRGTLLTMANATDLSHDLGLLKINTIKRKGIRYLGLHYITDNIEEEKLNKQD